MLLVKICSHRAAVRQAIFYSLSFSTAYQENAAKNRIIPCFAMLKRTGVTDLALS